MSRTTPRPCRSGDSDWASPSTPSTQSRTDAAEQLEAMVDTGWEWVMGMSAAMVAAALDIPFARLVTRSKERAPAPESATLPGSGLVIEAGTVGGVRWTWDAYSGDRVFLTIINEQTGVYGLGDGWRVDEHAPASTVTLDASPPMVATLTWPAGVAAADANAQLNAARARAANGPSSTPARARGGR